jgi:predicted ATPase/class 3 adenylate cyclase
MGMQPTGTVTLVFTDIEGSTVLLQRLGDRYGVALSAQRALLREAFRKWNGSEMGTEGDSFFVVFQSAGDALRACLQGQRALADHRWPDDAPVLVRMGVHAGYPTQHEEGYIGLDVHRAARIAAAAHGGQVLVSDAARLLAVDGLPTGVDLRDVGWHWLKDLPHAERLYQLVADGLRSRFPAPRSLGPQSNLPVDTTALLGREREVESVLDLLRSPDVRLVSLTGPGGIGKTRLAIASAAALQQEQGRDVFFVDLASVRDPGLVESAIATVLGVQESDQESAAAGLERSLRLRQVLLLLDNFEQVLPAAPKLSNLLRLAPGLRFLVTTRVALRLSGEREFQVPPLSVPALGDFPAASEVLESGAVALFTQRAQAVRPSFALDEADGRSVVAICALLEGMPLAIELAAARIRSLPVESLLNRLSSPLAILSGGSGDLPERQRTLRATIDWSYDLLSDVDRTVFRRLSVFVGGFTVDAAECIVVPLDDDAAPVEPSGLAVLDSLMSLAESSLLTRGDQPGGDDRHRLLGPLRDYAHERLVASGESGAVQDRHAVYYRDLVERAEPGLRGADQLAWLAELHSESANIDAALEWSIETGSVEVGLRIGAAVWRFWQLRGQLANGLSFLERLFVLPGAEEHSLAFARAKACAGRLAIFRGDHDAATRYLRSSLTLFRRCGDKPGEAFSLMNLGMVASAHGQRSSALSLLTTSADIWRSIGDPWGLSLALCYLGTETGFEDVTKARALLMESLDTTRRIGDQRGAALTLTRLGTLSMDDGDSADAQARLQEAVTLQRELSDALGLPISLGHLASLAERRDDLATAEQLLIEVVAISGRGGDPRVLINALGRLAAIAWKQGRSARAARLLGSINGLSGERGDQGDPLTERVRETLSESSFNAHWYQGATSSLDSIVADTMSS